MSETETRRGSGDALNGALALFAWGAAAFAFTSAFHDRGLILYGLVCLLAAAFIANFVHESGHALAALACRWRVIVFVVRPFGLHLPNRNLVLVPRRYGRGAGGWVASVPGGPGTDTKLASIIRVAGGPAASFLLMGVALLVALSLPAPARASRVELSNLWFGLAVLAGYGGIASLIFYGDKDNPSDGDQLRNLFRGDLGDAAHRSMFWIDASTKNKVRLRDVPDWLMAEAQQGAARIEGGKQFVAQVEIGRILDAPPVEAARARGLIDAFRLRFGASDWLAACDAWLAVMWEGDHARAQAVLSEIGSPSQVPALTFAVEAALAAWIGDAGTMRVKLAEMRKALKAESPFRDDTFREIGAQVEALLAQRKTSPARP